MPPPRIYAPPDPSLAAVDLQELVAALDADLRAAESPAAAAAAGGGGNGQAGAGAAAGDGAAAAASCHLAFQKLVPRLEALLALDNAAASRRLRRAFAPFDPRGRAPARRGKRAAAAAAAGDLDAADLDAAEVALLDDLVALLLRARYAPLTSEQWRAARGNVFTFDIPVRINWRELDPGPLRRYFGLPTTRGGWAAAVADARRRRAESRGGGSTPGSGTSTPGSGGGTPGSGTPGGGAGAGLAALLAEGGGGGGEEEEEPVLLPGYWRSLPPFSDRVLVFVRGVGASCARGQYYQEKMDLLASYVLFEPLAAAAARAWSATVEPLAAPLLRRSGALRRAAAWLAGEDYDSAHADEWRALSDGGAAAPGGGGGRGGALSPEARASLCADRAGALDRLEAAAAAAAAAAAGAAAGRGRGRRAARYVERRTLRTLLPTVPAAALSLLREEVLTEPTFKEVIVVYRQAAPCTVLEPEVQSSELSRRAALELAAAERRAARERSPLDAAAGAAASGERTPAAAATVGAAVGGALGLKLAGSVGEVVLSQVGSVVGGALGGLEPDGAPAGAGGGATDGGTPEPEQAAFNARNIQMKSFQDVAMSDLELVFPEKRVLVQPATLLKLGLAAASAVGAGAVWLVEAPHGSFSLAVAFSVLSVVGAKVASLYSQVTSHQHELERVMTKMQYDRTSASGASVISVLAEELALQSLKEAVTAYGVMLRLAAASGARERAGAAAAAAPAAGGGGEAAAAAAAVEWAGEVPALGMEEIDAECERFLAQEFGVNVDFQVEETMPLMQRLGLVSVDAGTGGFRAAPPGAAAERLVGVWERIKHKGGSLAAAAPPTAAEGAPPAEAPAARPTVAAAAARGRPAARRAAPRAVRLGGRPAAATPLRGLRF
ncbi:MAG: hypothetical protein J3K34DRAFT_484249 [Monoraphidium minutum]|nr:MAG: hypothetical protein J3K34DRAFT_484249 [Monoraphidium minutum]